MSDAAGWFPTEVPKDDYDIAGFENKFPSLHRVPPEPAVTATAVSWLSRRRTRKSFSIHPRMRVVWRPCRWAGFVI